MKERVNRCSKPLLMPGELRTFKRSPLYGAYSLHLQDRCGNPRSFVNAAEGIISNTDTSSFISYLIMMTGDAFNYGTIFAMSITRTLTRQLSCSSCRLLYRLLSVLLRKARKAERRFPPSQDILPSVSDFSRAPLTMYISEAAVSLPQTMRQEVRRFPAVLQAS